MSDASVPAPPAARPEKPARAAPQPEDGRCTVYMPGKNRYCRCRAEPGTAFCGAHRASAPDGAGADRRVPCPLDPSHTVWEKKLQQHLKVCSKLVQDAFVANQPFYSRGVNSGAAPKQEAGAAAEAARLDPEVWASRLQAAFPAAVLEVLGAEVDPDELLEMSVLAEAGDVAHAEKHEVQNQALAELACRDGLAAGAVVVEYGCGRAGLGAAVIGVQPGARTVLVDYEPRRHKIENRQGTREERILRLRLDVSDFDLGAFLGPPLDASKLPRACDFKGVPAVAKAAASDGGPGGGPAERLEEQWRAAAAIQSQPWPPPQMLACAKHLCGGGTDVALRSLCSLRSARNGAGAVSIAVSVCMATCCHHRCDAASYLNMPFLRRLGLLQSDEEISQLALVAAWAVGGSGLTQICGMPKRRIGMMAKRTLDLGRVAWLREELGLADATLRCYIDKQVTPENIAIFAGVGCASMGG